MQERKSKRISDDLEITVQQISPFKALRLSHKLAQAGLPAFAAAMGGAKDIAELDVGALAEAARLVFDRFSADDLESMTKELLEGATVSKDGGPAGPLLATFNNTFAGRIDLVYATIWFALQVNFASFWPTVRDALAARTAAAAPVSTPQST